MSEPPADARDEAFLRRLSGAPTSLTRRLLAEYACELAAAFLEFDADDVVAPGDRFLDLGFDSLRAVDFKILLEQRLGCALPSTVLFDCPTPEALVEHLVTALDPGARSARAGGGSAPRRRHELPDDATLAALPRDELLALARRQGALIQSLEDGRSEPIAVVGLACRFPGADDARAFWQLQLDGVDAIGDVPAGRWDGERFYDPDPAAPGRMYVRQGGFLSDVSGFDAGFFGITPREAAQLDPQHRLLLEVTWEALEHAGIAADALAGSPTGVFVGQRGHEYFTGHSDWAPEDATTYYATGNSASTMAGRVSYTLGLNGPCQAIDTACSSSLVAVHDAVQSLRRGECSAALAAGINLLLDPFGTIAICKASMLSRDGRCKTFDAAADGYVRSEGCGVLVLMRLSRAVAEGQRVLALIRGTASNQDGASGGLTVPSGKAQAEVIRAALRDGGLRPDEIDFVEAHGTGTSLGDPIEVAALDAVFGPQRQRQRPLLVGSVKTNIGHCEPAAGMAGLIKVILALGADALPRHLHLHEPNPHVPWDSSVVRVPRETTPWPRGAGVRAAGVSSFGFGGTNAHVVLTEAPPPAPVSAVERPVQLCALSAQDEPALAALAGRLAESLALADAPSPADACHTLLVGRSRLPRRAAFVAASRDELVEKLAALADGRPPGPAGKAPSSPPRIGFLFTGQGSQSVGMGRELHALHPDFRDALDACAASLRPHLGEDIREVLWGTRTALLSRTDFTQPALFALEHALAALWGSLGVRPDWVLGHSVGEYAAACLAGVLSLDDACALVAARGRLMVELTPPGAMVAVSAEAGDLDALLSAHGGELAIAALNSRGQVVLSGSKTAVASATARLGAEGRRCQALDVSHAFHSPLMEPMLGPFAERARSLRWHAPRLGFISCLDPGPLRDEIASPEYWVRHVREPVRFVEGFTALAAQGCDVLLEIGPAPVLLGLARRLVDAGRQSWLPSLRKGSPEWATLLGSAAALHVAGVTLDGAALARGSSARRCELPSYPFQRERHWLPGRSAPARRVAAGSHPLAGAALASPALAAGTRVHEARVSALAPAWLADHRAWDTPILPAAAFLEAALIAGARPADDGASGATASPAWPVTLEAVQLSAPLMLGENDTTLQLVLAAEEDGRTPFELWSRTGDAGGWMRHARGRVLRGGAAPTTTGAAGSAGATSPTGASGAPGAPPPAALDTVAARCTEALDPAAFYRDCDAAGLRYGPAFRVLHSLSRGEGECLAEVELPAGADDRPFVIHPALLDGCFQAAGCLAVQRGLGGMYLPVGFQRVSVLAAPGRRVTAHVALRSATADGRMLVLDLALHAPDGTLVARVEGQELLATSRAVLLAAADPLSGLGHVLEWIDAEDAAPAAMEGEWLLLGSARGPAAALAAQLSARGARPVVVDPASLPADGDAATAAWHKMLADRSTGWRAVVHLSALDVEFRPPPSDGRRRRLLEPLPALLRALERSSDLGSTRLLLVTRGAVVPSSIPRPLDLDAACLWGLFGSLALEQPQRRCARIDLDPYAPADADALARLAAALAADDGEEQMALRGGRRRVARLVRLAGASQRRGLHPPDAEAWRLAVPSYGVLERLTLIGGELPVPGPGELRIAVRTAALNFKDVLFALGLLAEVTGIRHAPDQPLGLECAGRVDAVGPGVTGVAPGDLVLAACAGALASHVCVPAHAVTPVPRGLDLPRAAGVQTVFLTALYGLQRRARLARGERVLIHAAAGGVGQAAIQVARRAGAEIFATASRGKHAHLRSQGLRHLFDSRDPSFADGVLAATGGRGVDVVLNSLTGPALDASLRCLSRGGRFVEIGKLGIRTPEAFAAERPDASYHAFDMAEVLGADPALHRALLDELVAGLSAGEFLPPPTTIFPLREAVAAFSYLAQARAVGKVVLSLPPPRAPLLREDRSYLVTGGLGALGLLAARQLADSGARRLVLVARRAPTPDAEAALATLRARGVEVRVAAVDLGERPAVAALLASIAPPLDGVIHAAGVLDDGLLANLTWERMAAVLRPKVLGAWHLHDLLGAADLSFFVCYSSMVSMTGAAGQGSYAAANAWLDALATHRRALGLAGQSLGWGPWAGAGMAAASAERNRARFAERGIGAIDPEQGLAILGKAITQGEGPAHLGVLPVDWGRYLASFPGGAPAWLSRLGGGGARAAAAEAPDDILPRLAAAAPEQRHAVLMAWIADQLARVMGSAPAASIDPTRPLVEMGVDSLLAVDLRNRVEASLQRDLPATLVFDHPTLEALVGAILVLLDEPRPVAAGAPP